MFGTKSTGAQNDLVRATEIARRMVREWGMSDRIGPMAWGSEGAVFLGEDLVHTRDYSDETARVIDEEVERILRDEENRTRSTLTEHRPGLVAVAEALLERETVDGAGGRDAGRRGDGPQERRARAARCGPTAPRRSSRAPATATPSPTTSSSRALHPPRGRVRGCCRERAARRPRPRGRWR